MELNLMKRLFKHLLQLVILVNFSAFANYNLDDQLAVKAVIQHYIDGTSKGEPLLIERAFHNQASLLLSHAQKPFWQVSAKEYASWFNSAKGKRSRRRHSWLARPTRCTPRPPFSRSQTYGSMDFGRSIGPIRIPR